MLHELQAKLIQIINCEYYELILHAMQNMLRMFNIHTQLCLARTEVVKFINKYGSYLLIRDWAGLKCHPVLKVWKHLQDKHSEEMQNSYR